MTEKTTLHMAKLLYKQTMTFAILSYLPVNHKISLVTKDCKGSSKMLKSAEKIHPTIGLMVSDNLYVRNYSDKCKGSDFLIKSRITMN